MERVTPKAWPDLVREIVEKDDSRNEKTTKAGDVVVVIRVLTEIETMAPTEV